MQQFHCATPEELHFYQELDRANLEDWSDQLMHDIRVVSENNAFFKEFHREWGHKAGVNSGNGRLLARVPAKLLHMATRDELGNEKPVNLLNDDRAWDSFIKTFPGLEVKPR